MMLGKKRRVGRGINDIKVGEKLKLTEKIEDRDLLLYLGLTNDPNPIYIQHDFASQTDVKKPIVPTLMLTGIITSAVSKYLPGPGSYILAQHLEFPIPVYHYETVAITLEVQEVHTEENRIEIFVSAVNEADDQIIRGTVSVAAPELKEKQLTSQSLDNF
ncbi:MaoC/PaaZ C-terminal domain-containing protein [Sporosarcina gallistercoris]|uniref:Enoyl-CoA hydratase n=1 Tax=Sporosarcina gallistercoris TaxID=2762245 RepID=A0ABR8PIF2_9BACL|nr:MaoC/PaaZ C-terminal domain-containing protein [Sporosarcina gallistercoris]MBD7907946.1 enoyl-CoA hydratase [Sporosarcina gallistercoris]